MAEGPAGVWAAGFCVSAGAGGGVCGRVLLARMPEVLPAAEVEPEVLGRKGGEEPGA